MVKYDLLVYLGLVPVVAVIMFSKTQTPPTCLRCLLAQTNDHRARAARKQLRLG